MSQVKEFTLRLPVELADELRNYAFVTSQPVNEVIKRALFDYLTDTGRHDAVTAAFQRVVADHAIALDKLRDL